MRFALYKSSPVPNDAKARPTRLLALCPLVYCLFAPLSATSQQIDPRQSSDSLPQGSLSNERNDLEVGIVKSSDWRVTLPLQSRMADGFTVDIFTIPANSIGYRPVHMTAKSTTTFPSERTLEVSFTPLDDRKTKRFESGIRSVVTSSLVLTQGDSVVSKDFYLPQYTFDSRYLIQIREAGQLLAGYQIIAGSAKYAVPLDLLPYQIGVLLPREILVDPVAGEQPPEWTAVPELENLLREVGNFRYRGAIQGPRGIAPGDRHSMDYFFQRVSKFSDSRQDVRRNSLRQISPYFGAVLDEDELWDSWLGYDGLDVLLLPLPMLERVALESPKQFHAIQDFAAAGGTLWLYGASSADAANGLFALNKSTKLMQDRLFEAARSDLSPAEIQRLRDHVWIREYVAGRIVLIQDPYPFPGSKPEWKTLLGMNQSRSTAMIRRGVDSAIGDNRYWNWVLADVAKPPVFSFLALLGLFAFFVGPVAYYVSSRLSRIYLMLVAAPVFALLTTMAMGIYGLVSDGLGYQGRVRQVTWVHSASGRGLEWSRATYFAGIQPTDGLQFPAQTAVYPYPQGAEGRPRFAAPDSTVGQIRLTPDQQIFQHGFLPGREQRQFVTFAPQGGLGGIQLSVSDAASDGAQTATAKNRFPYPLRNVLLRDLQGTYWFAEQVDSSEQVSLEVRDESEIAAIVRPIYTETMPELPEGFQRRRSNQNGYRGADRLSATLSGLPSSSQGLQDGIVENRLREWMQTTGNLPEGSFTAEADVTEAIVARPQARLSDSIHFVIGTWE
ncbi:hypothetical protein FF011L_22300 [Roseimaritima multifibrata]|uniref:Uncharacterized protein n=1 Tax=Roseimaritima multifibrata TaxID=1930274 RepID=A0A517MEZ5_9BACT|nr:hypothetical protein [Roseimaritima multifibrata]QDS93460.1 hypothetical protein FF011L_22300 [Roseimaritima multifibrata]